ncbi:MAG TPA: ABC transporter permease subunit [Candidatus Tectomicrobia bacterium]|nr:ABC transporter permease subunit [Candidatus Tectomicrobia bacterium]
MSSRRIATIAQNTFREAVRDRILYNLVLFALLLTVSAIFLGAASASQDAKIIVDLGLGATLLFGAFIAVLVGVGLVWKEIERRSLYVILAKPVTREEFLLGKYLGLCAMLAVNVAVMGAGVSLVLLWVGGLDSPLPLRIWPAVALIYLEVTILTAVALLFSSFSSPILSTLASVAVFVIGHLATDLKGLATLLDWGALPAIVLAVYYALPNLTHFSFITAAAHGVLPPADHVAFATAYAGVWDAVLVAGATLAFRRRDLK